MGLVQLRLVNDPDVVRDRGEDCGEAVERLLRLPDVDDAELPTGVSRDVREQAVDGPVGRRLGRLSPPSVRRRTDSYGSCVMPSCTSTTGTTSLRSGTAPAYASDLSCENRPVRGVIDSTANQLRVARRLAPRRGASFGERFGRLDDRFVFVLGSPRSGTTFLAGAIGSVPGFVDLGEVAPVKAAVPKLASLPHAEAAARLKRILAVSRRVGLVGDVRPVEQTPELAHIVGALPLAYPGARLVHIVRDGRDVVCSLLEKPWLRAAGTDDAGIRYGGYARFWVEPERREEFEAGSDARRAAWVWRAYVTAARSATDATIELRYEEVTADPAAAAATLGAALAAPVEQLESALARAHAGSVGRYRVELSDEQLADVEAEAGDLLRDLGYVSSASA
jgi:sulfotransferase family protein